MRKLTYTTTFVCNAPEELFTLPDEKLPEDWLKIIDAQNGLGCEGGGNPGAWCETHPWSGCYWFGGREYDEVEEEAER